MMQKSISERKIAQQFRLTVGNKIVNIVIKIWKNSSSN
jgi:hypothetical protein